MSTVSVRYIGLKDQEIDKPTKMVWVGKGSVREVSAREWPRMSKHTDMWELVEGQTPDMGLEAVVRPVPQEVDDADLVALTTVIKPAENMTPAAEGPQESKAPAAPDLYGMQTAELRELAKARNLAVDLTQRGTALRQAVAAALKA